MADRRYALLTPAKNEADFIERPLESVVRQTLLPLRWVIVSDGSTDATEEIVRRYQARHDFIELRCLKGTGERDFRSKAFAVNHAYQAVNHLDFDYVGNLDADIGIEPTYYEKLMNRLEADPGLGVSGGKTYDLCDGVLTSVIGNDYSIGGAAQFFRRACWEAVGGYLPIRQGGEDTAAEMAARMKGWRVASFADLQVLHYREVGTAIRNRYGARFQDGLVFHALGYHPLFFIARTIYRIRQPPPLLGALMALLGYLYAVASRQERVVPDELVAYIRDEQLRRLRLRRARSAA